MPLWKWKLLGSVSSPLSCKVNLPYFFCLHSSVILLHYCVLSVESLARVQRERDDAALQSYELKGKLDSAEADARARADDAARSAREEAEKRHKAAGHLLGAVTNSLSGSPK